MQPQVQQLILLQLYPLLTAYFVAGMGARTLANSQLCKDGGKHRSLLLTLAVKGTLLALFVHLIPLFRTQRIIMELLYGDSAALPLLLASCNAVLPCESYCASKMKHLQHFVNVHFRRCSFACQAMTRRCAPQLLRCSSFWVCSWIALPHWLAECSASKLPHTSISHTWPAA